MKDYSLCIYSLTYNHGPFIKDTMDGFCIQETDFPFVAVIVDDASTDNTQDVIQDYLNCHFLLEDSKMWETDDAQFIFAQHCKNTNCYFCTVFLKYNFYQQFKSSFPVIEDILKDAKYIALCEGDDYWIDSQKLYNQVHYLERNTECGLVHTYAKVFIQSENRYLDDLMGSDVVDEDVQFVYNSIRTLTVCFRKDLYFRYMEEINPIAISKKWQMGDYPLFIFIMMNSNTHFIPDVTAVYRVADNSATHSRNMKKALDFCYSSLDCHTFMARYYCKTELINKIKVENLGYVLAIYNDRGLKPNLVGLLKRYKLSVLYHLRMLVKIYMKSFVPF